MRHLPDILRSPPRSLAALSDVVTATIDAIDVPTSTVHVALSGGVDSTALALATAVAADRRARAVQPAGPPWRLVLHLVRHGTRPDSEAVVHVARLRAALSTLACGDVGLLVSGLVDAAGRPTWLVDAKRLGEEAAMRNARFDALLVAASSFDASAHEAAAAASAESVRRPPVLLTGHHADDDLETMLLRLVRGAGLEGVAGIDPISERAHVTIARPFLGIGADELRELLEAIGCSWVDDPTNRSARHLRNRIRHTVVPALRALRPGSIETSARTLRNLRCDRRALVGFAEAAVDTGTLTDEPAWYASLDMLRKLGPDAAGQVLRHAARRVVPGLVPSETTVRNGLERVFPPPGRNAPGGLWRGARCAIGVDGAYAVVRPMNEAEIRAEPTYWSPRAVAMGRVQKIDQMKVFVHLAEAHDGGWFWVPAHAVSELVVPGHRVERTVGDWLVQSGCPEPGRARAPVLVRGAAEKEVGGPSSRRPAHSIRLEIDGLQRDLVLVWVPTPRGGVSTRIAPDGSIGPANARKAMPRVVVVDWPWYLPVSTK